MQRIARRASGALAGLLLLTGAFWLGRHTAPAIAATSPIPSYGSAQLDAANQAVAPTTVYAHNILLRKGPHFRLYIRWIDGQLLRTRPKVDPSFDDPDSFLLIIKEGIAAAHLQDLAEFLNAGTSGSPPLKSVSLQVSGSELSIHGTLHRIVPLPVQLTGELAPLPDGRVRFRVSSYSVLKIPMKGLMGVFDLKLSELASSNLRGVQISGNDILFDTEKLLPPPHIHGQITSIRVSPQELTVIYGDSPDDENGLSQWHNFLRFRGGSLNFGKLTMDNADITMIDAVNEPWFDLDLVNYQAQLVNGYTRMTANAGLEIYMPDLDEMKTKPTANQDITVEWLKDRHSTLPADVTKAIQSSA